MPPPPAPGVPAPPQWGTTPQPSGTPYSPPPSAPGWNNQVSTQAERPAAPVGAFLALGGALLLIIGSVLPWFSLGSQDVTGFTELGGETRDGPIFVGFGVLFAAFGITTLAAKRVLAVAIIAVVLASFAVLAGFADFSDVLELEDSFLGASGQFETGPGLPIVIVGALLALAGSIVVLAKRRR